MEKRTKEKGITLIALVVTLVILIILASISINIILDNDGIIFKAQLAKDMTANAVEKEDDVLKEISNRIIKEDNNIEKKKYRCEILCHYPPPDDYGDIIDAYDVYVPEGEVIPVEYSKILGGRNHVALSIKDDYRNILENPVAGINLERIHVYYSLDEIGTKNPDEPDGIPDIYQITVTYNSGSSGTLSFNKVVINKYDENRRT